MIFESKVDKGLYIIPPIIIVFAFINIFGVSLVNTSIDICFVVGIGLFYFSKKREKHWEK